MGRDVRTSGSPCWATLPRLQYRARGACQALQDTGSLGHALSEAAGDGRDVVAAFEDYERRRVPKRSPTGSSQHEIAPIQPSGKCWAARPRVTGGKETT
jgi:hypothetical protein